MYECKLGIYCLQRHVYTSLDCVYIVCLVIFCKSLDWVFIVCLVIFARVKIGSVLFAKACLYEFRLGLYCLLIVIFARVYTGSILFA